MLNTAVELNDLDAEAAAMVRGFRLRVFSAVLACTRSIGTRIDPEASAKVVTAGLIGLLMTARIDPDRAVDLAGTIAADIRSW
jgi:predicted ATP-grasp superfamily ATP-dependent carboligase